MFRSSKVLIHQHENDENAKTHRSENNNEGEQPHKLNPAEKQELRVRISKLVLLLSRGRSGSGRKYKLGGDDEMMPPISNEKLGQQLPRRSKPQPPPLPYRLTFKGRKSTRNPWSNHKTVTYTLGFNSLNIVVVVEAFASGLRRVFVNSEEMVRQQAKDGEWTYSHFFSDQNSLQTLPRLGTVLKIVVTENQKVSLFADNFAVESLRKSSFSIKGSPPPPGPAPDVETMNISDLLKLAVQ
jgi:hypothetical protein